MSLLVRSALETLEDESADAALRSVACTTLLAALTAGVDVPSAAPMAVWRWLLRSGSGASALHLHELPSCEVARDAVRVLTVDPEAGDDARDLALAALHGENLAVVTDADVLLLAERVMDEGRTRRFTFLVEGVHELRGFAPDFLRVLRDRLAASSSPVVRAAAIEIGGLLARIDELFTQRMLRDVSPAVRRAALEQLERVEVPDRGRASALVSQHLGGEQHRSVVGAGLSVLGALVRREPETH